MNDETWIEPEERAYTSRGSQLRRGRALFPDGRIRAFRAGIPDTYFSIPAHARIRGKYTPGFITSADGGLKFNYYKRS